MNFKLSKIEKELIEFLHKEYIKVRIDNFFEIIKAYPDSSPILGDIRKSIGSIQVKYYFYNSFFKAKRVN